VIKEAIIENEAVARVLADPRNPTRLITMGLARGRTLVTLTDVDGNRQVTLVIVKE
jgi:hypothetical protein